MTTAVLDGAGRRRSPATMPGYLVRPATGERGHALSRRSAPGRGDHRRYASRPSRNHGLRVRALIAVLWRAGLRISETLALSESDVDPRRGSLIVRHSKGEKRREAGMDHWGLVEDWGRGNSLRMEMPALATPRNLRLWGMLERAFASPAMVHAQLQIASAADVRDVLPSVQAPVLVLRPHGNMLPEAVTRHVAELLSHASYQELPETDSMGEWFASYQRHTEQFMFGAPRDVNPGRALMTVLFTDIVGSTEQAALLGDARWREVLVAHERMLRHEVEAVDGRVVKLIGDGSLSTFDGPARAIRCAERICAAASELDVEIRAGLHTGECEVIDDDLAGMAVHIAARVSAHANAGQVLVSRTVRDLVTGSGIALQPRGEHELKGVPGSWELFAVGADTAPLPAPDQNRHLRPTDRVVLLAARRTPGLLRAASRMTSRRDRR